MSPSETLHSQSILRTSKIGLWRVEITSGTQPRFLADDVMDELLGVPGNLTPEERFSFHRTRIHPDDMALFQEYSDKLSNSSIPSEIVYRYLHPVQGEMLVRCSGSRDTSLTDCISLIGTHQDISNTARLEKDKFAEKRLAELNHTLRQNQMIQENYYLNLLDIQSCGLISYTIPEHRLIHINAEALRMYQLTDMADAQQRLGGILSRVYYPDPETLDALMHLRIQDGTVDYECILYKNSTDECHIMAKSKIIQIPSGERAIVTTFLDVSDMIVLQKALQKAEEGSQAKSAFLFAMSHDLRTPMNAIIGYAELMEAHWGEKELTTNYLKKLKQASHFLLSLIGNILEMARVESGKETLHEEPWNLLQLQDTVDILLDTEITRKHLTISKMFHVPHPYVLCDAMKMREIFMNLLSNAVKYTPDNGHISLSVEELPSSSSSVTQIRMIVEDSGIGISPEYLPHLFEPFSRERNSSESGIIGSGLGLKIVKSFVTLMNGTVQVDSSPGKGTRFTVTVPLQIVPQDAPEYAKASTICDQEILKNTRILLAEDNILNAEITQTILEDANISVDLAPDGLKALSMLKEAPAGYYDLILMDIQMPNMDGYQATKAIRHLPDERSRIPIVAMTANAFKENKDAAIRAGMNNYIVKPVNISGLLSTIASTLCSAK